ncbi:N-acetyltransferase [Roseobacter denitrificans]|uniref:Acetyltransferase, putative n=1 Tax=Roseobacter denitrificans (strain ATCC 33942 / OCh 114) TaxID=375451 RepID=Q167C7_ROSDO|nr:GNAT family N-acetyltransferase [Roseobacter denitrificans]ABG31916.1 acetyltransferase, putative [Roseobacter denitrificans OCh 114]AVL51459.1 N-acetyltransferase [Roseobacter denitrificans]SFG48294.1 Ribosomal protein S18 acetylase RimI [Roseobacter denitrificans OCh 114]
MSDSKVRIQTVGPADVPDLMAALQALARNLDDPFKVTPEDVSKALFGPDSFTMALLARQGGKVFGAVFAAPLFTTLGGGAVLYVSDLWVDASVRKQSLGRRLLAAAAAEGASRWQTSGIRLTVYSDNAPARAFYAKLGFVVNEKDLTAFLSGTRVAALQARAQ